MSPKSYDGPCTCIIFGSGSNQGKKKSRLVTHSFMGSLLATVGFKLRGFFGLDGNSPWATGAGVDVQYV